MTRDRQEADRLGRALLSELLRNEEGHLPGRLTLGALWRCYERACVTYLDNKATTRRDDETRAKTLLAFFGEQCDVRSLTARDQGAYAARRKAGGIMLADGTSNKAVRKRSVEMDLVRLHAMLTWATTVRLPNGGRLLETNPLTGVRREREQNPVRPVASWERFQRTRTAMQELQWEAASRRAAEERPMLAELEETRWVKMELALILAEATGRRLGSIRQLRWEDVDFDRNTPSESTTL